MDRYGAFSVCVCVCVLRDFFSLFFLSVVIVGVESVG